MADIDFPNNPANGTKYTFDSRTYTWYKPNPNELGYWRIIEPGTLGPATAQQLNEDSLTDDERDFLNIETPRHDDLYATPEALGLSNYLTTVKVETAAVPGGETEFDGISNKDIPLRFVTDAPGTEVGPGLSDSVHAGGINVTGSLNPTLSTTDIDFKTVYASVNQNGVVGMAAGLSTWSGSTMVNADSKRLVPSMFNLNDVWRIAANSAQQEQSQSGSGYVKNYSFDHSSTGIMFKWGKVDINSSVNGSTNFGTSFSATPYIVLLTHRSASYVQPAVQVVGYNSSLFSWRTDGKNTNGSDLFYLAIGKCGAQNNPFPTGQTLP